MKKTSNAIRFETRIPLKDVMRQNPYRDPCRRNGCRCGSSNVF